VTTETWAFHAEQLRVTADAMFRARADRDQHQVILLASSRWVRIRAGLAIFLGFESNDCGEGAAAAAQRASRIDALRYVHRFLSRRVPELIAAVPAAAEQMVASHARERLREARVADFHQMSQLVDCAFCALEHAASQCSSAGTMETLDLVTADKSISLLSTMSTSSADDALRSAQDALRALQDRFPKRVSGGELPEVSDLLDLAVDLMAGSSFDFTSFLSLSDLSGAESRARDAARALRPLRQRVRGLLFEQEQTLAAIRAEIDSAPSVYVAKARLEIPEPLRELSRDWRS